MECRNYVLFDEISLIIKTTPAIMKIDIEGFKSVVIEELLRLSLADKVEGLFIEISPKWIGSAQLDIIFNVMKNMGFTLAWKFHGWSQFDAYFTRKIK